MINNSPDVAPETREHVQRAISELNYHPNAQAVSLSRDRANIVGMVVDRAGDPFFGPMVDGACQALMERGRFMLLAQTDHIEQSNAIEALLRSRRIDGILLVLPLSVSLEQTRRLAMSRLPLVMIDLQYEIDADHIAVDNIRGAYRATKHLIDLGHLRIGHIQGREDIPVGKHRLDGYRAALEAHSLMYDPELVVPGRFTLASGEAGAEQLLSLEHPPTAIFASSDDMAFGALRAIHRRGMRIPEDISLIGYDDIRFAEQTTPPLTTVRQPLREMGYLAGQHICKLIDSNGGVEQLRLTMEPELVVRGTTAPPKFLTTRR